MRSPRREKPLGSNFFIDKLETEIERVRGSPLIEIERKLLRIEYFQSLEENSEWFSVPSLGKNQGYPTTLKEMVLFALSSRMITRTRLAEAGVRLEDLDL